MDTLDVAALLHHGMASVEEEMLIRNLLLSHDPDGRDIDSELLLQAVKNVLHIATSFETKVTLETCVYLVSGCLTIPTKAQFFRCA